jgi:hypothetical protein
VNVKTVIRNAIADMKFDPIPISLALLLAVGSGIIADLYMEPRVGFQFVSVISLFLLVFQIILTRRSLVRRNLLTVRHDPPRSFAPRAIGQSILWSLGMLAALLALLVPAIILLARWSICLPAMISEDSSVIESFKRSWTLTRGHTGIVLLAFLTSFVPAIFGIVIASFLAVTAPLPAAPESILVNSTVSIGQILWWFVQIEIYSQLYKSSAQVS